VIELLLQPTHLLHQLVGVVGGHLLSDLVEALQLRLRFGDRLLDVAEDGLRVVQRRFLGQQANGVPGHEPGLAVGRAILSGHDPQEAGLAGAVGSDNTDLRAGQEAQRDVVEHQLVAVGPACLVERVDELRHGVLLPLRSGRLRRWSFASLVVCVAGRLRLVVVSFRLSFRLWFYGW